MPDLLKKLEQSSLKRKTLVSQSAVLQEAQKLLGDSEQEDARLMRSIGSKSTFVKSEEEIQSIKEIEKLSDYFEGKVFTLEQIKELGVKYRLKLLNSNQYTSHIDAGVIPAIRNLERAIGNSMTLEQSARRNVSVEDYVKERGKVDFKFSHYDMKERFFILAPAKMFNTKKKALKEVDEDPIMFYTKDNRNFVLVKKWGTDFTVLRRIQGWITSSEERYLLTTRLVPIMAILSLISFLIIPPGHNVLKIVLAVIATLILTAVSVSSDDADDLFGETHVTSLDRFWI